MGAVLGSAQAQTISFGEAWTRVIQQDEGLAAEQAGVDRAKQLRKDLGNPKRIMLGVDRLDYTKGIDVRLNAFRELLEEGGEPYAIIMECVHRLALGQRLVVHALMQPRPLMNQLGRMGYFVELRHAGPDHWELEVSAG